MAGVVIASSGRVEEDITGMEEAITMRADLVTMVDPAITGMPPHGEVIVVVVIQAEHGPMRHLMAAVAPVATVVDIMTVADS